MNEIRPGVEVEAVQAILEQGVTEFTAPESTEIVEGVEAYELIFSKYKTIADTEFKFKKLEDYVAWQQDMLRCYTDSFLVDSCLAGEQVFIYCTEHFFKEKSKKGKGKFKATFLIKNEMGVLLDTHNIVLQKVHKNNVHKIIDGHIYLLEMALEGYLNDPFAEGSSLDKFGSILNKKNIVKATKEMITEIKNIRSNDEVDVVKEDKND